MKKIDFIDYKVFVNPNINIIEQELNKLTEKNSFYVITDKQIYGLYKNFLSEKLGKGLKFIVLEQGEKTKNLNIVYQLAERLIDMGFLKDDILVSFGGGVISDITALIASLLYRGVKFISIPTTLLSQIDASVGGKCGVNSKSYKNIFGTFYNPALVLTFTELNKTLPEREIVSGKGELFKYYLLTKNKKVKNYEENNLETIIYECLKIKNKIILKDFYDKNYRHLLNLGHTFGHIIEMKNAHNFSHGECVLFGIHYALSLGKQLKITKEKVIEKLRLNLFFNEHQYTNYKFDIEDLHRDKKNDKGIDFVFIKGIGKPVIKKVTWEQLDEFINKTK